ALFLAISGPAPVAGEILPSQVLVIYNSANTDSLAVRDYYVTARPGVESLDLADPTLLPGTISYANFLTKIRNPLRAYLGQDNHKTQYLVFVLTKGIPHRLQDTDVPNIGLDVFQVGDETFENHDNTCASVDSELTLVLQDLE